MISTGENSVTDVLVYGRIERDLRNRIAAGEWHVGSAFPSRRSLAKHYEVALGTIERAVANLLEDGTLTVVEGRGTFVTRLASPAASPDHQTTSALVDTPSLPSEKVASADTPLVVGLIVQPFQDDLIDLNRYSEWTTTTVRAIERALASTGGCTCMELIPPKFNVCVEDIRNATEALTARGVDGIIVIDYNSEPLALEQSLPKPRDLPIPVICATWGDLLSQVPHVFFDNRYMGYQAAMHLMQAGYSDLVYVAPHHNTWVEERYHGIRAAINQASGQRIRFTRFLCDTPFTEQMPIGDYEVLMAEQFLDHPPFLCKSVNNTPGTLGVIASNDGMAQAFFTMAQQAGLVVGHDYGLVGFDDRPFAREIGLTSLYPPLERVGEETLSMLIRVLAGEQVPVQVRLQAELVPRISTLRR